MIKKSKFYRGGSKFGYLPMKIPKNKTTPSTTFGTVRRFAPEPGSVSSKTQQSVLSAFKNGQGSSTQITKEAGITGGKDISSL